MKVRHPTAFWAGFTAAVANLSVVGAVTLIGKGHQPVAVVLTSLLVGAAAYGQQRVREAKKDQDRDE